MSLRQDVFAPAQTQWQDINKQLDEIRAEQIDIVEGIVFSKEKEAQSIYRLKMHANTHDLGKIIGDLENLIRNIHKGKMNGYKFDEAEISDIKHCISKAIKTSENNNKFHARTNFISALFEERLGKNNAACLLYAEIEEKFPYYRRVFGYHAELLFKMGQIAACKRLIKDYKPTQGEVNKYTTGLRRLAQRELSVKNKDGLSPLGQHKTALFGNSSGETLNSTQKEVKNVFKQISANKAAAFRMQNGSY